MTHTICTELDVTLPDRNILESNLCKLDSIALIAKGDEYYIRVKGCYTRRYLGPLNPEQRLCAAT